VFWLIVYRSGNAAPAWALRQLSKILILQKKIRPVGERCADSAENMMIHRKIWLRDHAIRLTVEILTTFVTAAMIGYWILQTSR
jgi:hypothetical protein